MQDEDEAVAVPPVWAGPAWAGTFDLRPFGDGDHSGRRLEIRHKGHDIVGEKSDFWDGARVFLKNIRDGLFLFEKTINALDVNFRFGQLLDQLFPFDENQFFLISVTDGTEPPNNGVGSG